MKPQRASTCPFCQAAVPMPPSAHVEPLNRWRGRLSSKGFRVEICEASLLSHLELTTPDGVFVRMIEPGRLLSPRGRLFVSAGPPVLLALLFALGVIPSPIDPLLVVSIVLVLAGGAGLWMTARDTASPVEDRVVDLAWTTMLPILRERGRHTGDADFLGGLAAVSALRGNPQSRQLSLRSALKFVGDEAAQGRAAGALAALTRLTIYDAIASGHDPLPLIADEVIRCFDGRLPLECVEPLLTGWDSGWWTPGNQARLRVLLCERASQGEWEPADLQEVTMRFAVLGVLLSLDTFAVLTQLWLLRTSRPWERWANCMTAFDLAAQAHAAELFRSFPDLLLLHDDPSQRLAPIARPEAIETLRIVVTAQSVVVQNVVFRKKPGTLEANEQVLQIGSETFMVQTDAKLVVSRLEGFVRLLFDELQPDAARMVRASMTPKGLSLRPRCTVGCPRCRRTLIPRQGETAKPI